MSKQDWTIRDYIEEMIAIVEMIAVPGMRSKLSQIRAEIITRFSRDEREAAGLQF